MEEPCRRNCTPACVVNIWSLQKVEYKRVQYTKHLKNNNSQNTEARTVDRTLIIVLTRTRSSEITKIIPVL